MSDEREQAMQTVKLVALACGVTEEELDDLLDYLEELCDTE